MGERGSHLSVGQRQRIGIARAFLKDAPILLLDEPTSALDPGTEHAIMETIAELMRGRTTLIITHRLATIHSLGRIVVLEHGTIAEQGTGQNFSRRRAPMPSSTGPDNTIGADADDFTLFSLRSSAPSA